MNGEDVPGRRNPLNYLASTFSPLIAGDLNLSQTADYRYSPAYTVSKWSTPQLTIHGSKDYRLPETDGIAVWHALQQYVPLNSLALALTLEIDLGFLVDW